MSENEKIKKLETGFVDDWNQVLFYLDNTISNMDSILRARTDDPVPMLDDPQKRREWIKQEHENLSEVRRFIEALTRLPSVHGGSGTNQYNTPPPVMGPSMEPGPQEASQEGNAEPAKKASPVGASPKKNG